MRVLRASGPCLSASRLETGSPVNYHRWDFLGPDLTAWGMPLLREQDGCEGVLWSLEDLVLFCREDRE